MAKTMATPNYSICPFTFKSIGTLHSEDVAIIYESNPLLAAAAVDAPKIHCGHSCTLSNLVSYLHDTPYPGTKLCPVCQSSSAYFICDFMSSTAVSRRASEHAQQITHGSVGSVDDAGRIVSFRYGTIVYFLWVKNATQSVSSSSYTSFFRTRVRGNALDRIAHVLDMDVRYGLKVIHKGKIIYPHQGKNSISSKDESSDEISEKLLDISDSDIIHCRKKPSLVVMGLRIHKTSDMKANTTLPDMIFSVALQITPWYLWNKIACGVRWTFSSLLSLLGGIFVFFRSILFPPQTQYQR
jgi:hypothetical protein